MNPWLWATLGLTLCLVPCLLIILRSRVVEGFVALQFASFVTVFALVTMTVGLRQPSFMDLALVFALLSAASGLLFTHFLERWL